MLPDGKMAFVYIIPLILGDWYLRRDERVLQITPHKLARTTIYWILILLIFASIGGEQSFIYFQF
jgi:hypothetical protein